MKQTTYWAFAVAAFFSVALSAQAAVATTHAPVINQDVYSTNVGGALTAGAIEGALSNDTDDDGDTLTATLTSTSTLQGTLVFNADGSFLYTPAPHWSGVDSFTYSASDGLHSGSATVEIVVSDTEAAPVTEDDAYATPYITPLTIGAADGVLANDVDPNSLALTAVLESDVNDGVLALNSDGSFSYTPDSGFSGLESFTYRAFNGSLYGSTRTAVITVGAAPAATSTTATSTPPQGGTGSTTPTTVTTTSSSGSSSGSGHHGGGHRSPSRSSSGSGTGGEVLGAQTAGECTAPYLTSYLRIGRDNNPAEMIKLQTFLNTNIAAGLAVSGIFDTATYDAVKTFQLKYWESVLKPWVPYGLESDHTPTGYVYKTTLWQINALACPNLLNPAPLLP